MFKWINRGIKVPQIYDFSTKLPSITLSFPYIAFIVLVYAEINLINKDATQGTLVALGTWFLATVLYMIRKITKAKFDLDDQSFDLEGEDDEPVTKDSTDN
jgi:hypothetical protein